MSRFLKLVLTLDTLLAASSRDSRAREEPHKQSLGPRASQKLHSSLLPLIKTQKVRYKGIVDGMVIPDWLVDVQYEQRPVISRPRTETVLIIAVDLAVQDPVQRATHAHARAWDIKKKHSPYDIRVVYDTHGQNGSVGYAVEYLKEYSTTTGAYAPLDISTADRFNELIHRVDAEAGHEMLA